MMSKGTITRRGFIKQGSIAAAGLAGMGGLFCSGGKNDLPELSGDLFDAGGRVPVAVEKVVMRANGRAPKPNIIVILTDDLAYGDLGCYGAKAIKTPNLDRMAREGVRFTDFYCSSPLCSPSRAGLLTGRYPQRAGIFFPLQAGKDTFVRKLVRNIGFFMGSFGAIDMKGAKNLVEGLPHDEITIPQALRLSGYTSAIVGKWHLGDFIADRRYHPKNYGFDHFVGFNASNDDWPAAFCRNDEVVVPDIKLDQEKYTGLFTREAVDFIEKSKKRPFFLYLAHKDPHQPCIPSAGFNASSRGGPYGDTVQEVDWSTGEIMKCLKRNGLESNTIVIFTSDNGPWYNGNTGGLRGRKGGSFEGGYRVPMIAWWPGSIPGGRVCGEPSMNIDFFPTLLSLAGLEPPSDRTIDGKNLWGLLSGKKAKGPHEELFFFHYRELEGVRSGEWKYFRYVNMQGWPVPLDRPDTFVGGVAAGHDYKPEGSNISVPTMAEWPILYNVVVDPGESYNVIKHHPATARKLRERLESFEKKFFSNPRGWLK
jgi:arylsulfatase A-like enzyme